MRASAASCSLATFPTQHARSAGETTLYTTHTKAWVLAAALGLASSLATAQSATVLDLPTRPGVTERVLVETPPGGRPSAPTLVLLMGGNGQLGVYPNGSLRRDAHFLARVRSLLTAKGHAIALVDAPSDRRDLGGDFRDSAEHASDLGAIITHARKAYGQPVWLVGHSRGTHSAVTAATHLRGEAAPDGIVLAASMLESSRFGGSTAKPLQESGVETLRMPVLVLHHMQDGCPASPAARLPELKALLPGATSRVITYEGGNARGAMCDFQGFHSFNGIEQKVVDDLSDYVSHPH